jgi:hypothetical protein
MMYAQSQFTEHADFRYKIRVRFLERTLQLLKAEFVNWNLTFDPSTEYLKLVRWHSKKS